MEDKDMIKAFAELEGVELHESNGNFYTVESLYLVKEYDPITDGRINQKAQFDYKVDVDFDDHGDAYITATGACICCDIDSIQKTIIEVILQSNK